MDKLEDKYSAKLENIIKQINGLKNEGGAIFTIEKRIELLSLGMGIIDKSFNELLAFKESRVAYEKPSTINYDYWLSDYAGRFYLQAYYLADVLDKNTKSPTIQAIPKQKRTMFLYLMQRVLEISARWDIERMINVFELDTEPENRAFPRRKPLLEECIFFASRMNATKMGIRFKDGIMPRVLIFAVQPNAGKSFVANVYSLMASCLHRIYYNTSGILRMSNNAANAIGFSTQIKAMIENSKLATIYPEFKKYFQTNKPQILEKTTAEEWKICGLDPKIRATYFARGREAAINSIRVFVALIIDDLSDGFEQMNNDEAHQEMTTKFEVDMDSRRDSEDIPVFIIGTMFNEFDVPNTIIKKLEENDLLVKNKKFRNVWNTEDFVTVVVAVDCFDANGESYAPRLISTQKLKDKQNSLKPYEFDLVYRQVRASREPRIFERKNLRQWKELPKTLNPNAIAVLDPTRTSGADFFALPVFREDFSTGKSYLVNAIYEQKSLGKISDPSNKFLKKVVKFIIDNNVRELMVENNVSNTIGTLLEQKFKELDYRCNIIERFTTKKKGSKNKLERILTQEATIVENIVFPFAGAFPPLHQVSQFMDDFTRFDSKAKMTTRQHDDAPDSVAMYADKYLFAKKNRFSSITSCFTRKSLWS